MVQKKNLLALSFLTILSGLFGLLYIKNKVRILEKQVTQMTREVVIEKEKIHVLKTELIYLSRPERIRHLAENHLRLQPAKIRQVIQNIDKKDSNSSEPVLLNCLAGKWRYKNGPSSYDTQESKVAQGN